MHFVLQNANDAIIVSIQSENARLSDTFKSFQVPIEYCRTAKLCGLSNTGETDRAWKCVLNILDTTHKAATVKSSYKDTLGTGISILIRGVFLYPGARDQGQKICM
jgi:hypothetical protein